MRQGQQGLAIPLETIWSHLFSPGVCDMRPGFRRGKLWCQKLNTRKSLDVNSMAVVRVLPSPKTYSFRRARILTMLMPNTR